YAQQRFSISQLEEILYNNNPYMLEELTGSQVIVIGEVFSVVKSKQGYPMVHFAAENGNYYHNSLNSHSTFYYNPSPLVCLPQETEPELRMLLKGQKRKVTGVISFNYPKEMKESMFRKEYYYHVRIEQCKFIN
ncbi:MAG: hypothetical protein LRY50_03905, partial [Geovibrio sp.]|nr:hypothetical protein [Geovibrio sp.]